MRRLLLLLAVALAAGCTDAGETGGAPDAGAAYRQRHQGNLTGEAVEGGVEVSPCSYGYCARRVVTVSGEMTTPFVVVDLATHNGDIDVTFGSRDQWTLEAVLEGYGRNASAAQAMLEAISLHWEVSRGDAHALMARAEGPGGSTWEGSRAAFSLQVSPPVILDLTARTANGGISVSGVSTVGLVAETANGPLDMDARVVNVLARTSNGDVEAALTPHGNGTVVLRTDNGAIDAELPEGPRHGYDLDAFTNHGLVDIDLRDGRLVEDGANDKRFTTTDFASREVVTRVDLTSANGGIAVAPA